MMKNLLDSPFTVRFLTVFTLLLTSSYLWAQNPGANHGNKFEQLGETLPDPNIYRGPDGAPGPEYWQQRADYDIECTLDVENLKLDGKELITYYNQSPHTLRYLWLQLDENEHSDLTDAHHANPSSMRNTMSGSALDRFESIDRSKYGHKIEGITDENGKPLKYIINQTMMRVDLPEALKPGEKFSFYVDWYYYITDRMNSSFGGRGGYEYFEKEDNYIFTITQWYPRLCVFSDVEGWQNKQFTGRGEFALTFGNFIVKMTVPEDHVVGSTGECLNYSTILTPNQLERWEKAKTAEEPIEIVTLDEAKTTEKSKKATKTKNASIVISVVLTKDLQKDYEIIPYSPDEAVNQQTIANFMAKYITLPFEYIDNTIGVELNFNKVFYVPEKLRTVIDVQAEIDSLEQELANLENELGL